MKKLNLRTMALVFSLCFSLAFAVETTYSGGKTDSCSLLTKEEVAEIMQNTVREVFLKETPRPNCNYVFEKGQVVVFLFTDAGARSSFETGRKMQDTGTQTVAGIGDDAYWSPNIKVLNVLKKQAYFTVQFIPSKDASLEKAKRLAVRAVTRLP
jgi:hypothetical protein